MVATSELPSPSEWGWNNDCWTTLSEVTQSCREHMRCGCSEGCVGLWKCLKGRPNALLSATVVDSVLVANVWRLLTNTLRAVRSFLHIIQTRPQLIQDISKSTHIHMCYMHIELSHRRSRFLLWNVSADMSQNNDATILILINNELNMQIVLKVI